MHRHRRTWAVVAGMALVGGGLIGLATPAAAAPADPGDGQRAGVPATGVEEPPAASGPSRGAVIWEEPVPGTSAEIEFTDAGPSARAASLSPYLAGIVAGAERVRTVDINVGAVAPALATESVAIELFDDVSIDLETAVAPSEGARSSDRSSRVYSAGGEDGSAVITIIGGDVHGVLWKGATRYGIEPLGGGRHLVFEDARTFPDEGAPVGGDEPGADASSPGAPAAPADAPADPGTLAAATVIDVMVAFDQSAEALFGSVAATEAEIVEMINVTNMVFANSENDQQVALTNIYDLNYTPNAADGTTDDNAYLSAIRDKTDGIVDDLHAARDANGADLVAVITDMSSFCGLAYLPGGPNSAEERAYSLTDGACAVGNLSFPHELGHNMCAHHDPANASTNPCEPDGYAHFSAADNLRTVMSYANSANGCVGCTRIPHFSNPNVTYDGWTTGVLGSRDNSRVLEVTKDTIAAYRTPGIGPCMVDYSITNAWPGNVQVELTVENPTGLWINGWTAEWTFTGDENVYNSWGVTVSQVGQAVTATSNGYGDMVPPGGSVTVGFQATVTSTPTVPAPIICGI